MSTAVLFSGGIDSTVATHHVYKTGDLRLLIAMDTGQTSFKHAIFPRLYACAKHFKLTYEVVNLNYTYLSNLRKSWDSTYNPSPQHVKGDTGSGWLDGRNAYMYLTAAIVALHHGCTSLVTGTQANDDEIGTNTDESPMRDNDTNAHCINCVNSLLHVALEKPFVIHAPFMYFSKEQVYWLGLQYDVDMQETYSCDYYPRCEVCSQCIKADTLHAKYAKYLHRSGHSVPRMRKRLDEDWNALNTTTQHLHKVSVREKYRDPEELTPYINPLNTNY